MSLIYDSDRAELIDRARQACAKAADEITRLSGFLAQARDVRSPGEALARSRLSELNELVENLNRRLESQPVIEQAKGILMSRSHCSPDEAFEMLRKASMRMNRKLRDVAADIVEAAQTAH